jgi:MFS family permease
VGGLVAPRARRLFKRRTDALILGTALDVVLLAVISLTTSFAIALVLLAIWCLTFAVQSPMRQAFVNGLIPSAQRATVLSFDNLMGSAGGVVAQPLLGRVADVNGYAASYLVSAAIQALGVPFAILARGERAASDPIVDGIDPAPVVADPLAPASGGPPVQPAP